MPLYLHTPLRRLLPQQPLHPLLLLLLLLLPTIMESLNPSRFLC